MNVVFDTNVIISGFLTTTGVSQSVFVVALKRHHVILSEFILEEIKNKLTDKLGTPQDQIEKLLKFLRHRTSILEARINPAIKFEDKKDIPILSLLNVAAAHYLITGDKKILTLKKWGKTLILSPREAMEVL